jgi:hypothetical protein
VEAMIECLEVHRHEARRAAQREEKKKKKTAMDVSGVKQEQSLPLRHPMPPE